MPRTPLFPSRTAFLLGCLCLCIVALAYIRIYRPLTPSDNRPSNPQTITPIPTPTFFPQITDLNPTAIPLVTSSPIILPTKPPKDSQTGRYIYTNSAYGFSFEYPSNWQMTEFHEIPQPLVLIGTGNNQDIVAFSITLKDWPTDTTLLPTASSSAFTYAGWIGTQSQTKQDSIAITVVTATKSSPSGQTLRFTWIRSIDQGNSFTVNETLKPILKSFLFVKHP
jgi:hypothetical protein